MVGQGRPAQVHRTRAGGSGGSGGSGHDAPDRGAGSVPTRNPGPGQAGLLRTPARSRGGRSRAGKTGARRGSLPRSGLGSLCKTGRISARPLTPELRVAAPLPPLPLARTPLAQPCAAAAATPAAVIPVAHPKRSYGPSRAEAAPPSASEPASEAPPQRAESAEAPPLVRTAGEGRGALQVPSLRPRRQAAGANGPVGRQGCAAECGLYLGEGGAKSTEVRPEREQ